MNYERKSKKELIEEIKNLKRKISPNEAHLSSEFDHYNVDLFSSLFEKSYDCILIIKEDTILNANPKTTEVFGHEVSELIGKSPNIFYHSEKLFLQHVEMISSEIKINNSLTYNFDAKHKNGSHIPVDVSATLMPDGSGVFVIRDISERIEYERQLKQSEIRLRQLANASTEGIAISDKGTLVEVNETFLDILGYDRESVIDSDIFKYISPESKSCYKNSLKATNRKPIECFLIRKDNSTILASITTRRIIFRNQPARVIVARDITEQRQSELDLLKTRESLINAQRLAHLGSWEMDIATGKSVWSDEFYRICGYKPGEIEPTAETGMNLIHPDDREMASQAVAKAIETKSTYHIEKRIVRPDGEIRHIVSIGEIETDKDGQPIMLAGSFHDVTHQQKLLHALKENENQYRLLMDAIPLSIFYKDTKSNYLAANDSFAQSVLKKPADVIGKTDFDLFPKEDAEKFISDDRDVLENLTTKEVDETFFMDGQLQAVHIVKKPVFDHHHNLIGLLGIFWDISERIRNEQLIKLNEKRLQALFDLSQVEMLKEKDLTEHALEEAVRITDSEVGYFHFVSDDQNSLTLHAWTKDTMKLCVAEKVEHYPISEAGIWADSARTRAAVIHNDYQNEPNRKGYPEGHFPLIRHMSVPVFNDDKVVAIVGVGNKQTPYDESDVNQLTLFMNNLWRILKQKRADVELKKLNEDLRESYKQLELAKKREIEVEKLQTANKMAGTIAHEFNNPLAVIKTSVELIEMDIERKNNFKEKLAKVNKQVDRMRDLVKKLLEIQKVEEKPYAYGETIIDIHPKE